MQNLNDYRVQITMNYGRQLIGLLIAFEKFMNLLLADIEEFHSNQMKINNQSGTNRWNHRTRRNNKPFD